MNQIKKNFGFGCMRLPMVQEEAGELSASGQKVDLPAFQRMVDAFMAAGFQYFDTAHNYLGGQSEQALKAALTDRYPRDAYQIADKLSGPFFEKEEDIRPLFAEQLAAVGVEYFDFYLMHAQSRSNYEKFKAARAYETAIALRAEGKVRHFGISFHDNAELLDRILSEYPEIEFVQLQINYLDWEDPTVQGRLCHEVCLRHGKAVAVMEPCKGGSLINLPAEAGAVLDRTGRSRAELCMRYAAEKPSVFMVLSGMSNEEQMAQNLSFMQDCRPLSEEEHAAIAQTVRVLREQCMVGCTACRYCVDGCPVHMEIPALIRCLNDKRVFGSPWAAFRYGQQAVKPASCIGCGKCEAVCPQQLPIRSLLSDIASIFEPRAK